VTTAMFLLKELSRADIDFFRSLVWDYYAVNRREFVWRFEPDPYAVVVSEFMLQQTQTERVAQKYPPFLARFSSWRSLAAAPLADVIIAWQGLGYNRRARFLHLLAGRVINEFDGVLPNDPCVLKTCSGIGPNTAGSICAFAFNKPIVFIETNIRAVFIHTFFSDRDDVADAELLPLIKQTLDENNPREWYYALMDYGVYLKKQHKNPTRKSKHHTIQSKFSGSDRQIRGAILRQLSLSVAKNCMLESLFEVLSDSYGCDPVRAQKILDGLIAEGMVSRVHGGDMICL